MGYSTIFYGQISFEEELSPQEVDFFTRWQQTRRCTRDDPTGGVYFAAEDPNYSADYGAQNSLNILNAGTPPDNQPGLWCHWTIGADNKSICWDDGEKFYNYEKWMSYIIEHFFGENPIAKLLFPEEFGFLKGHVLNGHIFAEGRDRDDVCKIEVIDNKTYLRQGSPPKRGDVLELNVKWKKKAYEVLYEPTDTERIVIGKISLEGNVVQSEKLKRSKNKI